MRWTALKRRLRYCARCKNASCLNAVVSYLEALVVYVAGVLPRLPAGNHAMPKPPAVDTRDLAFHNDPHTRLHRLRERGQAKRDVIGIWLATHHADCSTGVHSNQLSREVTGRRVSIVRKGRVTLFGVTLEVKQRLNSQVRSSSSRGIGLDSRHWLGPAADPAGVALQGHQIFGGVEVARVVRVIHHPGQRALRVRGAPRPQAVAG
jgi:hypothetical protein